MISRNSISTRRRVVRRPDRGLGAGVAEGLSEAYDVDPWLVRVTLTALVFVNGVGLVFYGLCWLLFPAVSGAASGEEG